MAESHVISALVEKHARLLGELSYHRKTVKRLEKALEATGESIKLFEPKYAVHNIKTIRRKHRSEHFQQGECGRLVLEILRDACEPLTTKQVVTQLIRIKGLELNDVGQHTLLKMTVNVLKGLSRRDTIKACKKLGKRKTRWHV